MKKADLTVLDVAAAIIAKVSPSHFPFGYQPAGFIEFQSFPPTSTLVYLVFRDYYPVLPGFSGLL